MGKIRILTITALLIALAAILLSRGFVHQPEDLKYGITFSKKKAADLGLDWRAAYISALDDLRVKNLRLPAYWDEVELSDGTYSWDELDWQIREASVRGVAIILAMGGRLPRWPECHYPEWSKEYPQALREERILSYIKHTVERYRNEANIYAWQVENEPFLAHFGDCPKLNSNFLDMEIGLVKALDKRPIVVTDSGELSVWVPAAKRADIFGTTMYRDTYSRHLKSYIHYPIESGFFRLKKRLAGLFANPKEWVVIELQAEPWGPVPYEKMPKEERDRTMTPEKFRNTLEFARQAGFREFYLWGAEWWYWEKTVNGDPRMWQEAKKVFWTPG